MNRLFLTIIVICLIACQKQSAKENNQKKTDIGKKAVINEEAYKDTLNFNSNYPLGKELKNAINDPLTDKYFLEVFKEGKMVPHHDDKKMLSITDSLLSNDQNKDFFYFVVFTKSLNGSDGFYSEAAGAKATEFITTKTEWFADYFNIGPTLTKNDMKNWASFIVGEIQIEKEGYEPKAINELVSKLRENLRGRRKEYSVVLENFIEYIKEVEKKKITTTNHTYTAASPPHSPAL
ncbi:hypothetical protein HUW51_17485 [Adhaeribacter swui]|uniref:Lipoprotein n=1 Tax=Adhaeribacter swui TaxID=2086471 RepID=A0A7G7GB94_9BACT|nr:hypothetical protein [Adhaeribacter swui]QNF34428.1 hypothetical protein HUW51_17485 [Adhaeribacter swui]